MVQRVKVALNVIDSKTEEEIKNELSQTLLNTLIEQRQIGFQRFVGGDGIVTIQATMDIDDCLIKDTTFYL